MDAIEMATRRSARSDTSRRILSKSGRGKKKRSSAGSHDVPHIRTASQSQAASTSASRDETEHDVESSPLEVRGSVNGELSALSAEPEASASTRPKNPPPPVEQKSPANQPRQTTDEPIQPETSKGDSPDDDPIKHNSIPTNQESGDTSLSPTGGANVAEEPSEGLQAIASDGPSFQKASTLRSAEPSSGSSHQTVGEASVKVPTARAAEIVDKEALPVAADEAVLEPSEASKLARGKAVRRISLHHGQPDPTPNGNAPVQSETPARTSRPLFSRPTASAAELRARATETPAGVLEANNEDTQEKPDVAYRLSAPALSISVGADSEPSWSRTERVQSQPDLSTSQSSSAIPPHREAALKRRELATSRTSLSELASKAPVSAPAKGEQSQQASPLKSPRSDTAPLIDFGESWPLGRSDDDASSWDLRNLMASTEELLQLLKGSASGPSAESSSQTAAKAAAAPVDSSETIARNPKPGQEEGAVVAPKKHPPPPPPLRTRKGTPGADGVHRRTSVLSTANSPITPYVSSARSRAASTSLRPPPLPTRRPPPPPPKLTEPERPVPSSSETTSSPSPPAFEAPPLHRSRSSLTSSSVSTPSDRPQEIMKPILPIRPSQRRSLTAHPKGPRPPTVPSRPWARPWNKVVANEPSDAPPQAQPRPAAECTQSENMLAGPPPPSDTTPTSPTRSLSVQDLRSSSGEANQFEFTDLDALVSRLEGSGREYEVSFLAG